MSNSVVGYTRVSTPDQNLERQIQNIIPYIGQKFDVDIEKSVGDVAEYIADPDVSDEPVELSGGDVTIYYDRLTGTDTDRDGYQRLIERVETGDLDAVVSDAVSRVSRSVRDLDRTADLVVDDNDTELHLLKEGFRMLPNEDDPYQKAMFRLLGVFAELEADLAQLRTKEGLAARIDNDDYHHGRAPLGFEKRDGELIPASDYDHVVAALDLVDNGELSKRTAAAKLDTSRRTINRSLHERRDLYGL